MLTAGVLGVLCAGALGSPPTQRLAAPDAIENGDFGLAIGLSGDTLVVGEQRDNERGDTAGAAYVFTREGERWIATAKLFASDAAPGFRFGRNVAIDADTLVVTGGGLGRDDLPTRAVYVFQRDGDNWIEQARLQPDELTPFNGFGDGLAIEDTVLVVGDQFDDDADEDAGAAHVYERDGTRWVHRQKLLASDGIDDSRFGQSVSLSANHMVIGANGYHVNDVQRQGVYVFVRGGTSWVLEQKLIPDEIVDNDKFGFSVAIQGKTVVVGAFGRNTRGPNSGAAYVFALREDEWTLSQRLFAADGDANDGFGQAVAIDDDKVVVTAMTDECSKDCLFAGAAYVYQRDGTTWTQIGELAPDVREDWSFFGFDAALDEGTVVIGAPWEDENRLGGFVYAFELPDCFADIDCDGDADTDDFFAFLDAFALGKLDACDLDRDGSCNPDDFFQFLDIFALGC